MKGMKLVLTDPEKLRLWRKKNKMSQAELAAKLKVHQTSVSKMEKGLIPVNDSAQAIMKGWKPDLNEGAAIYKADIQHNQVMENARIR